MTAVAPVPSSERSSRTEGPINLFGLDRTALRARFAEMGEAPYRADQVMLWIYRRGLDNFDAMSNLSKDLRERLKQVFVIQPPELLTEQTSVDGTRKWLLNSGAGQAIECVFIPETDRGTLCISSQVGCAMDCSFCATGAQGFSRNLSASEIVACMTAPETACSRARLRNVAPCLQGLSEPRP